MSLHHHIAACNSFNRDDFVVLTLRGQSIGFVRRRDAPVLAAYPDLFALDGERIEIRGLDAPSLTAAFQEIGPDLVARGLASGVRGEAFAIASAWGGPTLFELDRGLVPLFGTRSYGVHINGIVAPDDELCTLWIGRRAADKKIAPGQLDNMVAGGISSGYGAFDTVVKEAAEEADVPPDLAAQARPVGAITYRMELPDGMRNDTLFVYDLVVPADFEPRNTDGEIEDFRRMRIDECLELVRETDAFKFNVNLVLIDFAIRHGVITPEEPDYLALVAGLHR